MCIKVKNRIECDKCNYPYSEAEYPDDYDNPLDCNDTQERIDKHIETCKFLFDDYINHEWDCKCLICR